ncbi:hypothetical protein GCM10009798_29130 [Nocardioides panacihumi]|uniref:PepSY domain-containing protein n=1 Tax=Nocardioides panacihumi TaxID=400774 RepID=A0ABP5CSH0_9ACTN
MMNRTKKTVAAAALLLAGFGGGAAMAIGGSATAATGSGGTTSSNAPSTAPSSAPASKGHAGETPLTGTTAAKVKAAALAKYPGATIVRLETDSDGVYEAHVTTKAGDDVIVQVGKDFTVTGTQTGGGHGDNDGDGPAAG